jgi:hypothetical protein
VRWSDDNIGFRPRVILNDRTYGSRYWSVNPANPGNRPARQGAVVEPEFILNGAKPRTGVAEGFCRDSDGRTAVCPGDGEPHLGVSVLARDCGPT